MGRWNIIAWHLKLLMLIALCVDMAHITSRSTTHQMCSDDEYYDADRDSCFDLCRGKKCMPHQKCTEKIYGHIGPYICGDRCFKTCTLPMYCNTETAYCNPCSNICSYSDKDILRQCRIHCYDIYKDISASGFQTSTAPLTTTDSQGIIGPICLQNEYYDADRDMCLDMCVESKCQLDQICSTRVGGYTGPHFCVNRCKPTCDSPLYCSITTGHCERCLDICNDQNDETLRLCRIYCYDIYMEIVVSRTSTAAPLVSTSSEPQPTSDETISTAAPLVSTSSEPPPTSDETITSEQIPVSEPGLVAASVLVPVVICGVLLTVIALCVRRRRLQQRTGGPLPTGEDIPLMLSNDLDQYMTKLKESYRMQIDERNVMEKNQYGNVISLDQHQPVIINHGMKEPDQQKRGAYDEFVIEKSGREQLTLENFLHDDGHGRSRSVLMLGGPGMGKTSICYTILDWFVKGKWNDHQYIFFISLKGLVSMASSVSLADILFDYSKTLCNRENKETLIKQVEKRQKETLIVLDGYDECGELMRDQLNVSDPTAKAEIGAILKNLVRGNMLPDTQVLLTSRPFKSTNENLGVKKVVQLAGLTAASVKTLLQKNVTSKMDAPTLPDDIASLLSIPINLQKFLSYFTWIASNDCKFPRTKTSLFSVQMIPVLRQTLRFDDFIPTTELGMWSNPLVVAFLGNLAKLANTAFDELGNKQILFQSHELEQCGLDEDHVKNGGLMTSFTKATQERDGMRNVTYFYFIHLINLEWVGGLHIVKTSLDNIRGLIRRNKGQLDVILCFAVGLLGDRDGQEILERVHDMKSGDCRDKADQILSDIVQSDRCTSQKGGRQYALEVYHEGQFSRPHLLMPLLAPDGHALVVTHIAHYNRHVVDYFLSQLIASQDGQSEQAEAAAEMSNIDTMMLHFSEEADVTIQEGILREVGRLKKHKYLSIDTDGAFKAAVEQPLELLTVCGGIDGDDAAHIIGNNSASVLCLFNKDGCYLPGSWRPSEDLKEILLMNVWLHSDTMRIIAAGSSLRVIMWLLYNGDTAADVRRLIRNTPALQAVGLWLFTRDKADYSELSCVVSASSVACLSLLYVKPDYARHMEVIRGSLDNASLRELWLVFISPPSAAVLADLAGRVCRHGRLTTLSLVCFYDDDIINVSCFLRQLVDKPHSLRHIYTTNHIRSVEDDVARSFTGVLQQVSGDVEAAFFTPLVYSDYLLTSIPSHVKKVLTRRYVSPRH